MNVLFVSNLFPNCYEPARGVFNLHQMRHLAQLCEVRVLAPSDWFFIKGRFAPPKPLPETETIAGLTVHHSRNFYLPKIGRTLNPWFYAQSVFRPVRRIREQFPFDIIFVNWTYPDACGVAKIAHRLGVPFVVSISGSDVNQYLKLRIRRCQILRMLAQAKAITVRSQALRDLLIAHNVPSEKIHVLYNGVDRMLFRPRPTDHRLQTTDHGQRTTDGRPETLDDGLQSPVSSLQSPLLLYVGRLSPEKGVADLLRAVAMLKTPVRLNIVGDGVQRDGLRQLVSTLHLDGIVNWLGLKKPDEIPAQMAQADLLCLPSHMEGVPNVALEAFACGLPVVGTRVGGIPEIITETTGVLAEPRSPESFATALARALQTVWDGETIRRHAERFDWNENARQLFSILQSATVPNTQHLTPVSGLLSAPKNFHAPSR